MSQQETIGTTEMEDIDVATSGGGGKEQSEEKHPEKKPARPADKPAPGAIEAARSAEAELALAQAQVTASKAGGEGEVAAYRTSPQFFAMLAHVKAEAFAIGGDAKNTPIYICSRKDKISDVLSGMIKRNILSVPVLLESGKYYGFIDLMDVVRYVVSHFGGGPLAVERPFFDLLAEEKKFAEKTVGDLMEAPLTLRNPYHPIKAGYSAWSVLESLARERGLHRVPVIDHNRAVLNLVTQSQVIRFLSDPAHLSLLGSIGDKRVEQCSRLFKPVLSVTEDSLAIDAFNLMVTHDVQGVAIVNSEGRLRGNLSLRDLKLCGSDLSLFWRLHSTVRNFVLKLRHEFAERHGRPRQVVFVTPPTKLRAVIESLARHSIHRVYICNDLHAKLPIGVMTLQDILLELCDS